MKQKRNEKRLELNDFDFDCVKCKGGKYNVR